MRLSGDEWGSERVGGGRHHGPNTYKLREFAYRQMLLDYH